jgi:GGDEF domain-containing protein
MPPATPRRRRARPVADAPIDSLLTRSEDLAKGWLLALLEQAPLDDAPGILAADLSRDGPRICDAVLRAIADDTDLRRLEAGGALRALAGRAGELAGATAPAAVSRAVDALGAVIWSALRDELRGPDPDLVVELTERLTLVIELVRAAALDRAAAILPGDVGPGGRPRAAGPERGLSAVPHPQSGSSSTPAEATGEALPEPPAPPRPDIGDPSSSEAPPAPEALWVGALDDEIRRAGASPLSLLLTELEDVERVTAVETSAKATATFGEFAQAVRSVVRRQDILVCETDTRAWIIARDTARAGAQALGSRIADAVGAAPPWRGAPLVASVGAAVLGEDGRSAAELIESAEVARFGFAAGADEADGGEDG